MDQQAKDSAVILQGKIDGLFKYVKDPKNAKLNGTEMNDLAIVTTTDYDSVEQYQKNKDDYSYKHETQINIDKTDKDKDKLEITRNEYT